MRTWKKLVNTLTREPRGFLADGRVIGLGLDTAQRESEQRTTEEIEDFLRTQEGRRQQLTK